MQYRELGKTGVQVSEIGYGAEWVKGDDPEGTLEIVRRAAQAGVNIVDCWMADPAVRRALGAAVCEQRDHWVVQGHFGATWQDGQYVRTRDLDKVVPAWEFLLECFGGHIELGLIHYVDAVDEFKAIMDGPFIDYIRAEKAAGHIDHIGLSTHNPEVALVACDYPEVEMVMFSMNPAFDMLPPSENIETLFVEHYDDALSNVDPKRQELLRACSMHGVGITVMKPFAGGRLLDAAKSPFGAAMTTTQCIEYCLARPAVASVMAGYGTVEEKKSEAASQIAVGADEGATAAQARKNPALWLLIVMAGFFVISASFVQQLASYASTGELGAAVGAMAVSIAMIASIIGKFSLGWLCDHIGARMTGVIAGVLGGAGAAIAFFAGANVMGFYVGVALFGVGYSALNIVPPMTCRQAFGNKDYANIFSMVATGLNVFSGFAALIYAQIFDITGSFAGAFWMIIIFYVLVIVLSLVIVPMGRKSWAK